MLSHVALTVFLPDSYGDLLAGICAPNILQLFIVSEGPRDTPNMQTCLPHPC